MGDSSKTSEDEIPAQQVEQDDRRRELESREAELERRAMAIAEEGQRLADRRRELDEEEKRLRAAREGRAEELRQREEAVAWAEQERDAGFTEVRRRYDLEMFERRRGAEGEIRELRQQRLTELQGELAEERRRRSAELRRELDEDRTRTAAELDARRTAFEKERAESSAALKSAQGIVNQRDADLTAKELELDYRERTLDAREARLEERRQAQDDEVEAAVADRRVSYDRREKTFEAEASRLRGQLQSSDKLLGLFDGLKRQLGGQEPEQVVAELAARESALRDLREELAQRSPAMREDFERVCKERDLAQSLLEKERLALVTLRGRMRGEETLQVELDRELRLHAALQTQKDILEGQCNQLTDENKRLSSVYRRDEDREARICYRARELRLREPLSRRLVDGGEVATATMALIGLPVRSPLAAM